MLLCAGGVRRPGVDPGRLFAGCPGEPSGLGDVRLCLLLRADLPLDGAVRLRGSPQQARLGGCSTDLSYPLFKVLKGRSTVCIKLCIL